MCMSDTKRGRGGPEETRPPPNLPERTATWLLKSVNKMGLTETNIVKYVVFSFNLLFVITGIVILAIGATIQAAYKDYHSFIDDGYFSTPALLVAVGSIVLIIAFFGCCGAIKENYCMLITFAVLLVIVFILEISAGISGFVLRNRTAEMLTRSLDESMKHYGEHGHNTTSDLWDLMQRELQCCGIKGPADWVHGPGMKNGTLPVSCCPLTAGVVGTFHCSNNPESTKPPYTFGCVDVLGSLVAGHMGSVSAAAFSVTLVQALAVYLAVRLARALRNMKSSTLM